MTGKARNPPKTASIADPVGEGRLSAPSALRNIKAILDVIACRVPPHGTALEIASGTGEHVLQFARRFPAIEWLPSDIDPVRLTSIRAWQATDPRANLLPPVELDATRQGWHTNLGPFDFIIVTNLLHLISMSQAKTLIAEVALALAPEGVFCAYGPFLRGTKFASDGDRTFDQSLRQNDPEVGYKSDRDICAWQVQSGLNLLNPQDMPANNLILAAIKPAKAFFAKA